MESLKKDEHGGLVAKEVKGMVGEEFLPTIMVDLQWREEDQVRMTMGVEVRKVREDPHQIIMEDHPERCKDQCHLGAIQINKGLHSREDIQSQEEVHLEGTNNHRKMGMVSLNMMIEQGMGAEMGQPRLGLDHLEEV